MVARKFAIAFRLVCVLLVAQSHGQDIPPAAPEARNFNETGNEANATPADFAASLVGASSAEKAHNIGILVGIIFGSVAINIVTVFLIVFCLRGNRFTKPSPADMESRSQDRMSRRRTERKSRYDEIKDKYGLSGTDKYPRISSVQTSQSAERLLKDEPRESSRSTSERKKSSRGTRGSFADGDDERRSSAFSRHSQLDEDEEASPGEEKKSSIFSRLSSQIKDRVSSAIGDEGRKSSARQSQRVTDYADDERRSTARPSQRVTEVDERRSTARPSQRVTDYTEEDKRSSARPSQRATETEDRRSTARQSQRPTEAEERRSTARQTAEDRRSDEEPRPTESEQMRKSSASRKSRK